MKADPAVIGTGIASGPMSAAALSAVTVDESGVASGLLATSRQVGGTLGIAMMGAIVARTDGALPGETTAANLNYALAATDDGATSNARGVCAESAACSGLSADAGAARPRENAGETGGHRMRTRRALLSILATALAALAAAASAGTAPPPSTYHWAQPGCAPVTTPQAQLQASVPNQVDVAAPGTDYHWAQPGCAPVTAPGTQPPASAASLNTAVPGSDFQWGQPGCAPVGTAGATQPPATVPAG